MGVGQHDEGHAVAMTGVVEHRRLSAMPVDHPCVAALPPLLRK
jgi:hypothetical protein